MIGPAGTNLFSKGIYASGSTGSSAVANSGITINNCEIYNFFLTGGCAGVYAITGNTDWSITNNKVYQTAARTFTASGTMSGIYFANSTYGNNIQITGNTVGYSSNASTGTLTLLGAVAGAFQGIYMSALPTAATACNINTNTISDISLTSTTGVFNGIYNATTASSNSINVNSNQVKNVGLITTTGTAIGIYAGAATTLNCNTNTIDNITRNIAGTFYGINYGSPATITLNGNTIKNLSTTSTTSTSYFYAIYSGSSPVNENLIGNNIYNLTSSSTAAQSIVGWYNNTASGIKNVQNNNIYSITSGGGATISGIRLGFGSTVEISGNSVYSFSGGLNVYGIYISAGTTDNVFKNKIYNLAGTGTGASVYGIYIGTGTTLNIYNNVIGDLRAATATGLNAINGIYGTATSTYNVYYNTVYLAATSTSATTFGTSCAYFSSTATTFNLRNNVLVNLSTPAQEGLNVATNGISACLRRSAGTTGTVPGNYATTSNTNAYWCNPSAGTNNHLTYVEGSGTVTNPYNTVAGFATFLVNRDQLSVEENPTFVSTTGVDATFLHINTVTPTKLESGGAPIATYTLDYDGDTRNVTFPDIGADEFVGIPYGIAPVADFSADNVAPYVGQKVIFTDLSTNTPTAWSWTVTPGTYSMADGTTLTSKNPHIIFTAAGAYTIELTATNAVGSNTMTKTNYINAVLPAFAPVADFSASATVITNGGPVTFTDLSTNYPTSWLWSFTPNTVSYITGSATSQNPQVLFNGAGTYTVELTATNGVGSNTMTKAAYISNSIVYCASAASSTGDEDITSVQFGSTLNNASACASLTGTQGVATGTADLYSNFTGIAATQVTQGATQAISVQITECGGTAYGHSVMVYIDFNQNGLFTDAGEEFNIWPYASSNTHIIATTIAIPAGAVLGNTRMRVVCKENATTGPCLVSSWGETEDYTVNVIAPGTPTLTVTPSSLNFGNTVPKDGTSAEMTYSLSGSYLSPAAGDITLIPPANFEISTVTGGPYSSKPVKVAYTGRTLAATTIYVVFKPTAAATTYTGDITNSGGGATTANVAVSGTSSCGVINTFPYNEDFSATLNTCWSIAQVSGTGNWTMATSISYPDLVPVVTLNPQSGTYLAKFDSYNFASTTTSRLKTATFDFTSLTAPSVEFYMAHDAQYSANRDSINIQVSTNGGSTWTTLYPAYQRYNASFVTPGWDVNTTYLAAYAGMSNVTLAFLATGRYGNMMAIDNVTVKQGLMHDVGTAGIWAPTKLPAGQDYHWWTKNKDYGPSTETFDVDTKLQVNGTPVVTTTNTITALAPNTISVLTGAFPLGSYASGSSFDILNQTKLGIDQNAANDILINSARACVNDTAYAWDDGVLEGSIGYNTGTGWLGQMYYLSAQDTLTSATITWGTIPGALAGNSLEIYNVSGGLPTTKFADIATGISLTSAETNTLKTYRPVAPIIMPAGIYWIGAHQSVALTGTYLVGTDETGLTADNYITGFAMFSANATAWTDYVTQGLTRINMIRPNFANIVGVLVANPTAFTATPVSSSMIDLAWTKNSNSDNVMIATNSSNTFGTPDTGHTYAVNDLITGGGTVIYIGSASAYSHSPLSASTNYYYKAFSVDAPLNYSPGTTTNATTLCASESITSWLDGTRCGTGTVNLSVVASGGTIRWYAAASGGSLLGTGPSYTTPSIAATTTYHAEASTALSTFNVGLATDLPANLGSYSGYGMYFSTVSSAMINSVKIYPSTAGTLIVSLENTAGVVVDTRSFTILAGEISTTIQKTLDLNFAIPAGSTGWQLYYDIGINRGAGTYSYPYTSNGFSITGNTLDGNNITGGSRYYFYDWSVTTECNGSRQAVVATVTSAPALTITGTQTTCANAVAEIKVTSTISDYDAYVWTPSADLYTDAAATIAYVPGASANTIYAKTATAGSTVYTCSASNAALCTKTATTTVNVNPAPSTVSITPASASILPGAIQVLVASGGTVSGTVALSENFNSGVGSFSVVAASSTVAQDWTARANGYVYSSYTFSGSTGGFMMANSDVGGSGATTNTELVSPSFSTLGFTGMTLNLKEYLNNSTSTAAAIEISDDNFVTSTVLRDDVTNDIGSITVFASTSLSIPVAFENKAAVKIRFRYVGSYDWFWAVDEVSITGTASASFSWSPITDLYTNAGATVAYTGTAATTVYAKPSVTITYTATATSAANCTNANSVTVTVLSSTKELDVVVYLEGPYAGGRTMTTMLNALLPLTSPYGTGETVLSIPNADIVDWVLVDIRDAATPEAALPGTSIWEKACFLKSDGQIVDHDGTTLPNIGNPTVTNNLYVVVRHRNHIAVMSSAGMTLNFPGDAYVFDFSSSVDQAYGSGAGFKEIETGVFGMVAGDSDADGDIALNDYTTWAVDFGNNPVYLSSDNDMDGDIALNDYTKWAVNFGISNPILAPGRNSYKSQVPNK